MNRFLVRTSLLALAICFPLLFSAHAAAQSTMIILTADEGLAQASNDGDYPKDDVAHGETLYWSNTPDSLNGSVSYSGPATTLVCEGWGGYDSWSVGGSAVVNFIFEPKVGSNYVECYANGVTAEVEYTVLAE
jgi:hypothetical protein